MRVNPKPWATAARRVGEIADPPIPPVRHHERDVRRGLECRRVPGGDHVSGLTLRVDDVAVYNSATTPARAASPDLS